MDDNTKIKINMVQNKIFPLEHLNKKSSKNKVKEEISCSICTK